MSLHFIWLILALPIVLTHDKFANYRTRRMLLLQPHQRKNIPFVIRVPYSKVAPNNHIFSHSVAWKAKQPHVKSGDDQPQQQQPDVEVSQFHSQDTSGQVVFGFNSPDQMRFETRNADGTVHGTYSYLDPYGQIIKRQYWDTGAGFHVTSNTYPLNNIPSDIQGSRSEVHYTPEVQAARDLHFQLYQQALASLLPNHRLQVAEKENSTSQIELSTQRTSSLHKEDIKVMNSTVDSEDRAQNDSEPQDEGSINILEPHTSTQNGSIVIQNPEYLRISWTTENKKYRLNLSNVVENSTNPVHDNALKNSKKV